MGGGDSGQMIAMNSPVIPDLIRGPGAGDDWIPAPRIKSKGGPG